MSVFFTAGSTNSAGRILSKATAITLVQSNTDFYTRDSEGEKQEISKKDAKKVLAKLSKNMTVADIFARNLAETVFQQITIGNEFHGVNETQLDICGIKLNVFAIDVDNEQLKQMFYGALYKGRKDAKGAFLKNINIDDFSHTTYGKLALNALRREGFAAYDNIIRFDSESCTYKVFNLPYVQTFTNISDEITRVCINTDFFPFKRIERMGIGTRYVFDTTASGYSIGLSGLYPLIYFATLLEGGNASLVGQYKLFKALNYSNHSAKQLSLPGLGFISYGRKNGITIYKSKLETKALADLAGKNRKEYANIGNVKHLYFETVRAFFNFTYKNHILETLKEEAQKIDSTKVLLPLPTSDGLEWFTENKTHFAVIKTLGLQELDIDALKGLLPIQEINGLKNRFVMSELDENDNSPGWSDYSEVQSL